MTLFTYYLADGDGIHTHLHNPYNLGQIWNNIHRIGKSVPQYVVNHKEIERLLK